MCAIDVDVQNIYGIGEEMTKCKYCGEVDAEENMHQDRFTKEFYHEDCRPQVKIRRATDRRTKAYREKEWDGFGYKVPTKVPILDS